MGIAQKLLMHVQPMHERLPHHRQAIDQTIMQLYEFVWHANQMEIKN